VKALVLVLALVVVLAAPASASQPTRTQRVNLDGDRARERVVVSHSIGSGESAPRARVDVLDRCRGAWRRHSLAAGDGMVERAQVVELDGRTARRELLLVLESGAGGVAKAVRLDGGGRTCARPRTLFEHSPQPPPSGHALTGFDVRLAETHPRRSRGIAVVETYGTCAWRRSDYHYDRGSDRYALAATSLETASSEREPPPPDVAALADALRQAGLPLCPASLESTWFFDARMWMYASPRGNVSVFEFESEQAARAIRILGKHDIGGPSSGGLSTLLHIDWIAGVEPHWWRSGRLVVLYTAADAATLTALRGVLGPELWP
jgi:hypothetical protein